MSATDELRRLLDERGVKHYDGWSGEIRYTKWQGNYGMWFLTHDSFGTDGKLLYVQGIDMTPEQAVEATLGSDLKAENEKLREERDMYRDLVGMMDHPDLNVQLQAENAKLRELVRELYDELDAATQYDAGGGRGVVYEFANRMHELGVEV